MPKALNCFPLQGSDRHLQAIVTDISPTQMIAFTFLYGDPDLAVELVLPAGAFREFCVENGCHIAAPDDRLRAAVKRLMHPVPVTHLTPTAQPELHS